MPNVPNIAGQNESYLIRQLEAFRSGDRADPQMTVIAGGLTDEDIGDLAAWYASIEIEVTVPEWCRCNSRAVASSRAAVSCPRAGAAMGGVGRNRNNA